MKRIKATLLLVTALALAVPALGAPRGGDGDSILDRLVRSFGRFVHVFAEPQSPPPGS
jgi:hypothetical protein